MIPIKILNKNIKKGNNPQKMYRKMMKSKSNMKISTNKKGKKNNAKYIEQS